MNTRRLRRLIGLLLTALLLIGVFVLAATTAANERKIRERAEIVWPIDSATSTVLLDQCSA